MQKRHIVRLTAEERECLNEIMKKLKGRGQKVRQANTDSQNWTDKQIAEALCRKKRLKIFDNAW